MTESNLPQHVAIIMDGNGRWAERHRLSRTQGHIAGARRAEEIVDAARELGIRVLTLFTFSTENWSRPEQEVSSLMNILVAVLQKKIQKLHQTNIRFQIIGRLEGVPDSVLAALRDVADQTRENTGLIMNLAFNYGARTEMVDAIKSIVRKVQSKEIEVDQIDESLVNRSLYTRDLPDPDLLIRTSGEKRISNFLLWQLSYAELYFTETFWPDFGDAEFRNAISEFQRRERRFGRVT
jgi:undecaprenyl diphosphate synthase